MRLLQRTHARTYSGRIGIAAVHAGRLGGVQAGGGRACWPVAVQLTSIRQPDWHRRWFTWESRVLGGGGITGDIRSHRAPTSPLEGQKEGYTSWNCPVPPRTNRHNNTTGARRSMSAPAPQCLRGRFHTANARRTRGGEAAVDADHKVEQATEGYWLQARCG